MKNYNNTIYVSNLPKSVDVCALRNIFSGIISKFRDVQIMNRKDGSKTKYGFVSFHSREDFVDALSKDGNIYLGNQISVKEYQTPNSKKKAPKIPKESRIEEQETVIEITQEEKKEEITEEISLKVTCDEISHNKFIPQEFVNKEENIKLNEEIFSKVTNSKQEIFFPEKPIEIEMKKVEEIFSTKVDEKEFKLKEQRNSELRKLY